MIVSKFMYDHRAKTLYEDIEQELFSGLYQNADKTISTVEKSPEQLQENSIYSKGFTFSEKDRILTLSTCTNVEQEGRYAVHAKLVSITR